MSICYTYIHTMDQEYQRIRSNFVGEMQKKIEKYKSMREKCFEKCLEDCKKNLKLSESEKPQKTVFSTFSREKREADKQVIKDANCKQLANNTYKCRHALTTTPDTKGLFLKLSFLEDEITGLYEMYEEERRGIINEETKFEKGLIDIRLKNDEGEFHTVTVSPKDSVLDVKRNFGVTGDLEFKGELLDDNSTLRDYMISYGAVIGPPSEKYGGANKRKTMRRKK